jgi:hypothetical protein
MESELLKLKRNAIILGLCGQYKGIWDNCKSKKDLVDAAIDANGIEFMADSIAFGWGLSKEFLITEFDEYINGKYRRIKDGYSSELHVGEENNTISVMSTLNLFAYSKNVTIYVPQNSFCRIYLTKCYSVRIKADGKFELYVYGSCGNIGIGGKKADSFARRDILASEWINSTSKKK